MNAFNISNPLRYTFGENYDDKFLKLHSEKMRLLAEIDSLEAQIEIFQKEQDKRYCLPTWEEQSKAFWDNHYTIMALLNEGSFYIEEMGIIDQEMHKLFDMGFGPTMQ